MPSGKKSRQERKQGAPPPVRSQGGAGSSFAVSRRTLLIALGVIVLAGLGIGFGVGLSGGSGGGAQHGTVSPPPLGSNGFEGIPLESGKTVAPPGAPSPGGSIDGISCSSSEQLAYHIHVRLTVFVDGQQRVVPAGVGFGNPQVTQTPQGPEVAGGSCVSWLHTHTSDGIIHIESPTVQTYTLGNFFDIWRQPLSATQVGSATGPVTVFVNGKRWSGDPRSIPLKAHTQIQLDVGKPIVGPENITDWAGL